MKAEQQQRFRRIAAGLGADPDSAWQQFTANAQTMMTTPLPTVMLATLAELVDNEVIEYRVTFGGKYAEEQHPHMVEADPDGWLAVVTDAGEVAAREAVIVEIGRKWCALYHPDDDGYPTREDFPKGELRRIEVNQ